jgi:hypothetical protein
VLPTTAHTGVPNHVDSTVYYVYVNHTRVALLRSIACAFVTNQGLKMKGSIRSLDPLECETVGTPVHALAVIVALPSNGNVDLRVAVKALTHHLSRERSEIPEARG